MRRRSLATLCKSGKGDGDIKGFLSCVYLWVGLDVLDCKRCFLGWYSDIFSFA